MNLLHLRYFVELAHTQHYTRAAERLCITQPSLSHAIAQMESELGVPLFEKRGRNVALTHFGEQFLTCAQQTLDTLEIHLGVGQRVGQIHRVEPGQGVVPGHDQHQILLLHRDRGETHLRCGPGGEHQVVPVGL